MFFYRFKFDNVLFSSYPTLTVVPMSSTDDQVRTLSNCHVNGRYPVAVWMHPTNGAVILRSSAMRNRTASILFKHGQSRRKFGVFYDEALW